MRRADQKATLRQENFSAIGPVKPLTLLQTRLRTVCSRILTGEILAISTGTRLCACEILDRKMQLG